MVPQNHHTSEEMYLLWDQTPDYNTQYESFQEYVENVQHVWEISMIIDEFDFGLQTQTVHFDLTR